MIATPYESQITIHSTTIEGASFAIFKMSFARRLDLMKSVRRLLSELEFNNASPVPDKMANGILSAEIDLLYLRHALVSIHGLTIDGGVATPETLISSGPEPLVTEVVSAIKQYSSLTEEEKKT